MPGHRMTDSIRPGRHRSLSPQHKEAISRRWTPERREAWRQWVLQNRPWERVKVRKTPEWRDHLATICKRVDGFESKAFAEERRALNEALRATSFVIASATEKFRSED